MCCLDAGKSHNNQKLEDSKQYKCITEKEIVNYGGTQIFWEKYEKWIIQQLKVCSAYEIKYKLFWSEEVLMDYRVLA